MVGRRTPVHVSPTHAAPLPAAACGMAGVTTAVAALLALITAAGCGGDRKKSQRSAAAGDCAKIDRIVRVHINDGTPALQKPVRLESERMAAAVHAGLARGRSIRLAAETAKKTGRPDESSTSNTPPPATAVAPCGKPWVCRVDLDLRGLTFEGKGRAWILISLAVRPADAESRQPPLLSRGEASKTYEVARTANLGKLYLELLEKGTADVFRYVDIEHTLRRARPQVVAEAIETGTMAPDSTKTPLSPSRWQPILSTADYLSLGGAGLPSTVLSLLAGRHAPRPLKKGGQAVQEIAMKVAGMRKLKQAVNPLIKVLKTGSTEQMRDLALDGLKQIGDRRAVPHLTHYAEFADTVLLGKVIEALTQIGGPAARQFLKLTADGHPDEDIRTMARSALERTPR